jgi:predicted permease
MRVIQAKSAGFCYGVERAVRLAEQTAREKGGCVMLGSITTPACYVMAKQMGHEGVLTGSVCVTTTLFSAFSLTFWLFVLRSLGYIL